MKLGVELGWEGCIKRNECAPRSHTEAVLLRNPFDKQLIR